MEFAINKLDYLIRLLERKHSLIGKTAILHIVISGSSPDVSMFKKIF